MTAAKNEKKNLIRETQETDKRFVRFVEGETSPTNRINHDFENKIWI